MALFRQKDETPSLEDEVMEQLDNYRPFAYNKYKE